MAMPFLNSTETPLNFSKYKKTTRTSNLKSFWAFLLSIFLYMSAFYLFKLSPSSLVSTTKFWFFISNTLILIIAADFGKFSSSNEQDFYQEYTKNIIRVKSVVPISISPQHNKILDQPLPYRKHEKENEEKPSEKIVDMIEPPELAKSNEIQENNKPELLTIKDKHDDQEDQDHVFERIKKQHIIVHPEAEKKSLRPKKRKSKWARSESNKENREKMVLQRTLSERHEDNNNDSEFSNMSNEELNKRVEEFILKCNRQIRLQAVRSRQHEEGQNREIVSSTRLYFNTA